MDYSKYVTKREKADMKKIKEYEKALLRSNALEVDSNIKKIIEKFCLRITDSDITDVIRHFSQVPINGKTSYERRVFEKRFQKAERFQRDRNYFKSRLVLGQALRRYLFLNGDYILILESFSEGRQVWECVDQILKPEAVSNSQLLISNQHQDAEFNNLLDFLMNTNFLELDDSEQEHLEGLLEKSEVLEYGLPLLADFFSECNDKSQYIRDEFQEMDYRDKAQLYLILLLANNSNEHCTGILHSEEFEWFSWRKAENIYEHLYTELEPIQG